MFMQTGCNKDCFGLLLELSSNLGIILYKLNIQPEIVMDFDLKLSVYTNILRSR